MRISIAVRPPRRKNGAMGTPPAEFEFDAAQVRELLMSQHPDLGDLPLCLEASGWDNVIYRLGSNLALRMPRRSLAAKLIENEQRWLPALQQRLPLLIPTPVRHGLPTSWYPWCWSIIPWFDGETADRAAPNRFQGAALAEFFNALHVAAPAEAPRNPYRGGPLRQREEKFQNCLEALAAKTEGLGARLIDLWQAALEAPIDVPDTWIHGDLHPRNVLVDDGRFVAIIDWGDLAAGDRACDLAAIWLLLPEPAARESAMLNCESTSPHTWDRARGWALLLAVILLEAGYSGDPRMGSIARRTLQRLLAGP
jgi:aminoglycoside phosphotransferase (APT) family kinase protein